MKLIKQSYKIWGRCPTEPKEALRWIERAGRVCYASEDKLTAGSAEPFVRGLIERGHMSVLEHQPYYFLVSDIEGDELTTEALLQITSNSVGVKLHSIDSGGVVLAMNDRSLRDLRDNIPENRIVILMWKEAKSRCPHLYQD